MWLCEIDFRRQLYILEVNSIRTVQIHASNIRYYLTDKINEEQHNKNHLYLVNGILRNYSEFGAKDTSILPIADFFSALQHMHTPCIPFVLY